MKNDYSICKRHLLSWMLQMFVSPLSLYSIVAVSYTHLDVYKRQEDVDLSWRLRAAGYRLRYCPDVWIRHYSYLNENEVKPTQYVNALINNLLWRQRYGTFREKVKGYVGFLKVLAFYKPPYSGAKKELWKGFCGHISKISSFQDTALRKAKVANFLGWDYERCV